MRAAVIDIGTVTTRLLVAEVVDGVITEEFLRRAEITDLGDGMTTSGRLSEAGVERVCTVITEWLAQVEALAVDEVYCVATSAARDAENGAELVRCLDELGVEMHIIDGEREAGYAFVGATYGIDEATASGDAIVADVGGGSTEIVTGVPDGAVQERRSIDIGSRRLTDMFLHDDPPTAEQIDTCREYIRSCLGASCGATGATLVADNVSVTYELGDQHIDALRDVSVSVRTGELVVVQGPTGSGKSTLLKVLAGLLKPQAGTATLDGVAVTDASNRGKIGLMFQDPESALFGETVLEDVAFGPRNFGASPQAACEAAEEALRRVGLDPAAFGERSPFHLSGGEARRVAVAGILAFAPQFILADEPTAGLDDAGRTLMIKTLVDMTRTSGVVIVTHSPELFEPYATQVVSFD
ncbi:MAG: ATP-binding cassette domain-containing protein [Coriobacteriia bacterium]|nr:ATP-binding cassette domain-containing protein [Coriobacteriia bacterium]